MAKPRGKPFEKGSDPRRSAGGQTKAQASFRKTLREMVIEEGNQTLSLDGKKLAKVRIAVRALWNEAMKGEAWAWAAIRDQIGETPLPPKQEIGLTGAIDVNVNTIRVRDIVNE